MTKTLTRCENGHEHEIDIPENPGHEIPCPDCFKRLAGIAREIVNETAIEFHDNREICTCDHCVENVTAAYVRHLKARIAARKSKS